MRDPAMHFCYRFNVSNCICNTFLLWIYAFCLRPPLKWIGGEVLDMLANSNTRNPSDWEWFKQLRFYFTSGGTSCVMLYSASRHSFPVAKSII